MSSEQPTKAIAARTKENHLIRFIYYKIKVCWEQDKTFSGKIQHRPKMRRSLPAADSDPPKKSPSAAARHTSSRSRSTRRHESAAVRPANCGTVETREISYNKEQAVDDVDGLFRTRSRDRTGTAITGHRILSPACLPIPPSEQPPFVRKAGQKYELIFYSARKRTVLVRLDAGDSASDSGDGRGNRKPYHPL